MLTMVWLTPWSAGSCRPLDGPAQKRGQRGRRTRKPAGNAVLVKRRLVTNRLLDLVYIGSIVGKTQAFEAAGTFSVISSSISILTLSSTMTPPLSIARFQV